MSLQAPSETALRILTSAESLFAKYGYAAVSLRQITAAAQVNLAAVNYHYYDKESLYREILTQRLRQVNARRLALLGEAERRAQPEPASLPEVIDALARPVLMPDEATGADAARLLGRLLLEELPFKAALLEAEFHPVMIRFGQALRRHTGSLPPTDFLWRFSFVVGALHHALVTRSEMGQLTHGICRPDDIDGALTNFTEIALGALTIGRAPRDFR